MIPADVKFTGTTMIKQVVLAGVAAALVVSLSAEARGPGKRQQTELDYAESTHLVFMREEEKLARDVFLTFAQDYPNQPVFQDIGEGSEQTHTDVIRDKLEEYGVPDPNPEADNLPTSIGVYTGAEYGAYFAEKYSALVTQGKRSELDALYVGALIEEIDMHDIVRCPKVIVEMNNGIGEDGCGLVYTDESSLQNAYRSLVDGSENHLRAFVGQIEAVIGVGNYEAQYISQEEVDSILGR